MTNLLDALRQEGAKLADSDIVSTEEHRLVTSALVKVLEQADHDLTDTVEAHQAEEPDDPALDQARAELQAAQQRVADLEAAQANPAAEQAPAAAVVPPAAAAPTPAEDPATAAAAPPAPAAAEGQEG